MNKKKKEELGKVPTRLLLASIKRDIRKKIRAANRKNKRKVKR